MTALAFPKKTPRRLSWLIIGQLSVGIPVLVAGTSPDAMMNHLRAWWRLIGG